MMTVHDSPFFIEYFPKTKLFHVGILGINFTMSYQTLSELMLAIHEALEDQEYDLVSIKKKKDTKVKHSI